MPNTTKSYSIDDGNGNPITAGLPAHTARRTAQRIADERGISVYLYSVPGDGDAEEFTPSARATITIYRLAASYERDGQILDCTSAEVLGDAYGEAYATEEAARAAIDELEADLGDLDPTTSYSVRELVVTIADVTAERDEHDGITVCANVTIDGATRLAAVSAKDRHIAAGILGCEPDGDGWYDVGLVDVVGREAAEAVSLAILEAAPTTPCREGLVVAPASSETP